MSESKERDLVGVLPAGPDRKLLVLLWVDRTVKELHVMDDVLVSLLDIRLVLDHGVFVPERGWQSVHRAAVECLLGWKIHLLGCKSQWEKTRRQVGNFRTHQPQSDQPRPH